ncbi:MAG: DeoR/GlpR transcriptional regulator [Chloroflexaceae bacterium]|nr:DeoR/GlpR transcriptional regulator [Chloroflexaceae bacterium]
MTSKAPLMLDRRSQIAALVRQQGVVRVQELAELFQVSEVTIRGDLARLEQEGVVIRDRGGAVANNQRTMLIAFEQRKGLHQFAKQRIGQAAAQMVSPGDTIIMDAGTTVVEMAKHLTQVAPLTVVTNAINAAAEMGRHHEQRVLLLGGTVNYDTLSTLGPMVEQGLNDLVVQKLFLAAQSVDRDMGVTDTSPEIAQVKRAMVRVARRVILLADSSKWQRAGFIKVVPFDAIHAVVSDTGLTGDARATLERAGIKVVLV